MTLQEQELIQACKKGDRKAQNAFYDHYKVKMFGVCMRYASNREEAEDMLLEGFFRVFKDLHQFRNQCPVEAWIRKVMINSALMYFSRDEIFSRLLAISECRLSSCFCALVSDSSILPR